MLLSLPDMVYDIIALHITYSFAGKKATCPSTDVASAEKTYESLLFIIKFLISGILCSFSFRYARNSDNILEIKIICVYLIDFNALRRKYTDLIPNKKVCQKFTINQLDIFLLLFIHKLHGIFCET